MKVIITTICDNYGYDPALRTSAGFSCLVEVGGEAILFDTGAHSPTLLYNMQQLAFDPKEISKIVLSHIDGDHVGGLFGVLETNRNVMVYMPSSFPAAFTDKVKSYRAEVTEIRGPTPIVEDVASTGELGTWIKEQSLIVSSEKGIIIVVGCAHPGIVNIVEKAKELTHNRICLVLGGFHLGGASVSEINSVIESFRALGVEKVAPGHCSGDNAKRLLQAEYKEGFIENGVGKVIRLP